MNAGARLTLVAVWLLVGFGLTGWAETIATHSTLKGDTALAIFRAPYPQDPCLLFTTFVIASEHIEKISPGDPPTTVRVVLGVVLEDVCFGIALVSGQGDVAQAAFQVAGHLNWASLRATVPVADTVSLQLYNFDVDLTWTATGEPVSHHDKEKIRDRDAGLHLVIQTRGLHVPAVAMGSVLGLGDNYTPEPSVEAELQTVNDGTITIQQTR